MLSMLTGAIKKRGYFKFGNFGDEKFEGAASV